MKQKEYVVLLDENDNQIGLMEKMEAHRLGLLHRAFSVFIFRKKNEVVELLLQQRAQEKYHCGGLWTNSCCSHPREGEPVIEAGKRRLKEEMGIDIGFLEHVGSFLYRAEFQNGLIEHEIDHVLIGTFDSDSIDFNQDEVDDYKWIELEQLKLDMEESPEKFTPWLEKALLVIPDNKIKVL